MLRHTRGMAKHTSPQTTPPSWEQLTSWVAVVDAASVSAAASRLGISQAGVSQHIRQLERSFDAALLDRSTRPARPTAAGQRLYEHASELIDKAGQMAESIRALSRSKRALVRFGCVDSFAAAIGPQLVKGLLGRLHRVRMFSGITPDLNRHFDNHQLDLIMTTGEPSPDAGMDSLALFTEQYLVALPTGLAVPAGSSLRDLSGRMPFLHYSTRSMIGSQIENYLRTHDPGIEKNFEFDATDPLLGLVKEGLGFALTTPLCLWQSRHLAGSVQLLALSAFSHSGRAYPTLERQFRLYFRRADAGTLPREVADLVRVAARDLQRQLANTLQLDPDLLVIEP